MNVFCLVDTRVTERLTEDNYSEKTNRKSPYYRPEISAQCPYFAVCPECGNPIQIINIFRDNMIENITGRKGLHAKHYNSSIPGLALYDKRKYVECVLKAKVSLGYKIRRTDEAENEHLRELVENNRNRIFRYIKEITNIFFKNDKMNNWIEEYLHNRYYEYKGANERNLPYSILVTSHSINIFGQRISDSELGNEIKTIISEKSKFFKIVDNRIVSKVQKYAEIHMLFYRHKIEDEYETIKVKIFESDKGDLLTKEMAVMDCPLEA